MPIAVSGPQPGAKRFLNYVVIILVLVAIVWFLIAMSGLEKEVERVAINKSVADINASMALTMYKYISQKRLEELQKFHHGNPFIFMAANYQLPLNYRGTIRSDNEIFKSGWYFNMASSEAIYQPTSNIKRESYMLEFRYLDLNQTGVYELASDSLAFFKMVKK